MLFNPGTDSDLPNSVNSVEALVIWAQEALAIRHPEGVYNEFQGSGGTDIPRFTRTVQPVIQNDLPWYIGRTSIELQADHLVNGTKVWQNVIPYQVAQTPPDELLRANNP